MQPMAGTRPVSSAAADTAAGRTAASLAAGPRPEDRRDPRSPHGRHRRRVRRRHGGLRLRRLGARSTWSLTCASAAQEGRTPQLAPGFRRAPAWPRPSMPARAREARDDTSAAGASPEDTALSWPRRWRRQASTAALATSRVPLRATTRRPRRPRHPTDLLLHHDDLPPLLRAAAPDCLLLLFYFLLILMLAHLLLAAAPPPALPLLAWAALPDLSGRSRKGGPARSGGPPFLESQGGERKLGRRRGGGPVIS